MSIATTQRSWQQAREDALALRAMFPPACFTQWRGAGSMRRKKPEVSDVEHVILPNHGDVNIDGSMFVERVNLLWHHLDALLKKGDVEKAIYGTTGYRWGEVMRGVLFRGMKHEFWTATPENFGAIFVIRTGPADFSHRLQSRLHRHGRRNKGGDVWRCDPCPECAPGEFNESCQLCDGTRLVPVPDEETYFALCGMNYIEPERRL